MPGASEHSTSLEAEKAAAVDQVEGAAASGKAGAHNLIPVNFVPREQLRQPALRDARVGEILIARGLVSREDVEGCVPPCPKKRIGALMVERGLISEDELLAALAEKFSIPLVDLSNVHPTPETLSALPQNIIEKFSVFPVELRGRRLVVATSEPTDSTICDTLGFISKLKIEMVIATSAQISCAIGRCYGDSDLSLKNLVDAMADEEPVVVKEEEVPAYVEPDSKVINLVNKILVDAYNNGASDVHFEPELQEGPLRVRYRVDGECRVSLAVPAAHKSAVIARLKIMSRLDIAERRKPQSGKIVLLYDKKKIEYRVEITPTVEGQEDAVLRLLTGAKPLSLEDMGFTPENLEKFQEVIRKPHGIILCVGPTGSGKTTTLHSALAALNSPERKIWTAEDPVEIIQKGLRQVQVNPKIGFGFEEAMRSFLRADPDVIMIGEMRDVETSKTALAASLTGHLVFSTLHTNSAPETVTRLIEMGLDPYTFADALLAVVAQRLARRLCDRCRRPGHPSLEEYREIVFHYGEREFREHGMPAHCEALHLMTSRGCRECGGSGYRGRIALHEVLCGSPAVKAAIKNRAPLEELRETAMREGLTTLKMDGIRKVFQGLTDLRQILKVCSV